MPNVQLNSSNTQNPNTYTGPQYRIVAAISSTRARREPARAAHHKPSANPAPTPIATVPSSIERSAT